MLDPTNRLDIPPAPSDATTDREIRDMMPPAPQPTGSPLRVSGEISLGAILQAVTVAGSVISATFAAGAYVQGLKDEIVQSRQAQVTNDAAIVSRLQALQQTAASAVSEAKAPAPAPAPAAR